MYKNICLAVRTHDDLNRYRGALEGRGIPVLVLDRDTGDDRSLPGLRMATMHRVKGLEFEYMVIAGMNAETMPLRYALRAVTDEVTRLQVEAMERSLLHVAVTRARKRAYVTGWGDRSPVLSPEATSA